MHTYLLTGKIHPERVNFSLSEEIPMEIIFPDFKINIEPKLTIRDSKIIVQFQSEIDYSKDETCNLETLKNYVEDSVRLVVDIYCFVKSYNYDVEITKAECEELKIDYTYGVRGEWNIEKSVDESNQEFTSILFLFAKKDSSFLKDVFADFRRAIKYPAMTASFCFRAIETIRESFFEDVSIADDNKRRRDGWEKMNNALGYTESDFSELKSFALPNRHGRYPTVTYQQREKFMNFTRELVNKLLENIRRS